MNYLKYIEFTAENLQFYLWYQDYAARFGTLPQSEKVLSPQWSQAQAEAEALNNATTQRTSHKANSHVTEVLKDTDFAIGKPRVTVDKTDPFNTPDKTPSLEEKRDIMSEYGSSTDGRTLVGSTHRSVAEHAFDDAGLKWKPCTIV